MVNLFMVISRW